MEAARVRLQPRLPSSHSKARGGSMIVFATISRNYKDLIVDRHGRISSTDYLNILGDYVRQCSDTYRSYG